MLNPLIHKHPSDTLHNIYCVLAFLESVPEDAAGSTLQTADQAFGFFCIIRCLKGALRFEMERSSTSKQHTKPPHPAQIVRQAKAIKHPQLRSWLLSTFLEAIERCN